MLFYTQIRTDQQRSSVQFQPIPEKLIKAVSRHVTTPDQVLHLAVPFKEILRRGEVACAPPNPLFIHRLNRDYGKGALRSAESSYGLDHLTAYEKTVLPHTPKPSGLKVQCLSSWE